ncbi:hypothetical protein [Gorillibacterium timonense]|uniref:hypothetical protein n=1 Tax=Gorillibacterium timonense TaxID=1689269 RepID=UPI00071DE277|nr:hypothetical protein [Gorillibacterium timonense]
MRERIQAFLYEYDNETDHAADEADEQRSLYHPLVFLCIGDQAGEALRAVHRRMKRKCVNSSAIVYLHLYENEPVEGLDEVLSLSIGQGEADRKSVRPELHRRFREDKETLAELNRLIRRAGTRLAENGLQFGSFGRLSLAVITRADDPANALLPEAVLLTRGILGESFKHIQMDLFTLLKEGEAGDDFAYSSSLGLSFLKELDSFQLRSFRLNEPLLLTQDGFSLSLEHGPSPLFDLVYLLSDKDEAGLLAPDGLERAYRAIASLSLLKNRRTVHEFDRESGLYNNLQYKQSIMNPAVPENVYSSAGYAEVRRPNAAIAATVLQQFFRSFTARLEEAGRIPPDESAELFGLDASSVARLTLSLLPPESALEELNALLSRSAKLADLQRLNLREALEELYGGIDAAFFKTHFEAAARDALEALPLAEETARRLSEGLKPPYSFYSVYHWTRPRTETGLFEEIHRQQTETRRQLTVAREELQAVLDDRADKLPAGGMLAGARLRKFRRALLEAIYPLRYQILALETRQLLLDKWEEVLALLHRSSSRQVEQLGELSAVLDQAVKEHTGSYGDYLSRNLPEYYGLQTKRITESLVARRGPDFYFDGRFFGDVTRLLEKGTSELLERLIAVCRNEVFTDAVFRQSFEEELLERANVTVRFEEQNLILPKEELFRDLYERLESGATIRIALFHYTQKHRYEEKYFFGDYESEFIRYSFGLDRGSRTYQLGCVHEKKTSGIDKLNIMGGFRLADALYVRNAEKYYSTYVQNGFRFHPEGRETIGGF